MSRLYPRPALHLNQQARLGNWLNREVEAKLARGQCAVLARVGDGESVKLECERVLKVGRFFTAGLISSFTHIAA